MTDGVWEDDRASATAATAAASFLDLHHSFHISASIKGSATLADIRVNVPWCSGGHLLADKSWPKEISLGPLVVRRIFASVNEPWWEKEILPKWLHERYQQQQQQQQQQRQRSWWAAASWEGGVISSDNKE
jgi:hypothetical protein